MADPILNRHSREDQKPSNTSPDSLITNHIDIWTTAIERKSSAGRGTSNKFSLYGIKKLRELILELAVRGKLVPQDENEEPASVLLERIAVEKAQLVKEGKLKKQKPLPEISEDEKPFELPNGWAWTCLAELAEIGPRNSSFDDDTEASFVPMPLISTSYKGDHGSETRLWKEIKKGYTHFADGDIGLAKITPCFENSKAAVFSGLVNGVGTGTTELHIARPIESTVDPLFILLYLKAPMFLKVGETKMTGTAGQKRVPKDFFAYNPLPFAPLEEQHRIVAKVDELMSLCDALEAQTEASISAHQTLVETLLNTLLLPNISQAADSLSTSSNTVNAKHLNAASLEHARGNALESSSADSPEPSFAESWQRVAEHFDTLFTTEASIDTLKQTILQLAVMGKLVEQDPNDEPAAKLLERITAEKAQLIKDGKIKKQKTLHAITDEEKPFELPQGWEFCRLGEVLQVISDYHANGGYKILKENVELLDAPDYAIMLRTTNFSEKNYNNYKYITEQAYNFLDKSKLYSGDIIMNKIGDPGASFYVDDRGQPMSLAMNLFLLRTQSVSSRYVFLYLSGNYDYIRGFANGTSTQTITKEAVASLVFSLPPLEEQHRIVAKVDELMTLCDQLKARLSDAQTSQLHLTDAIVEQAV